MKSLDKHLLDKLSERLNNLYPDPDSDKEGADAAIENVSEASGDTPDEWLHAAVIGPLLYCDATQVPVAF